MKDSLLQNYAESELVYMNFALIIVGLVMVITTYSQSKSDNSVLSETSLKAFKRTIVLGYIIGALAIILGIIFLCISAYSCR